MPNQTANAVTITRAELEEKLKGAQDLIKSVSWTVSNDIDFADATTVYVEGMERESEQSIGLIALFEAINPKDELFSDAQMHVLRAIRTGLQLGEHVAGCYSERAGIPDSNRETGLSDAQKTAINIKKQTAAAVALFCFARYVIWDLRELVEGNAFLETVKATIPEVELSRIVPAQRASTFYLGKNIEAKVQGDDGRLVAVVQQFAETLQQEIVNRQGALQHTTAFTDVTYLLEETDFNLHGFEVMDFGSTSRATVKRVERDEMIGNTEAIDPLFAAIDKLVLYDPKAQMNPVLALGKFPNVFGLDGDAGNGKTLLGSAGATRFSDRSKEMGLPYKVMVVPSFVDKYQGVSEKAAVRWITEFMDPRYATFGIGDEFEQVVPDHGDSDSSEGQKGVGTAFLKAWDGVSTIARGDSIFVWMTNYIEIIDKAWLSRTNGRAYVGGAETLDDYIRFLVLMLRNVNTNFPGLINITSIDWDMNLRAPQVPDTLHVDVDPSETVEELYRKAQALHDNERDVQFLATFFWLVKKRFKAFSFRSCKNAIEAVTAKVADFEVPEEFVSNPGMYAERQFEEKQGLVADLARAHVKEQGVDFSTMLNESACYFANEALRVGDVQHRRAVEEYKRQLLVQRDARQELGL